MGILFITGACGSGKSTTAQYLQQQLDPERFVVHDFDELGLPEMPDEYWRKETTDHWLQKAATYNQQNKSTIICGFTFPSEVMVSAYKPETPIHFGLLSVSPDTIFQRLGKRGWHVNPAAIMNNMILGGYLESKVKVYDHHIIIEAENMHPEKIALQCKDYILKHLDPSITFPKAPDITAQLVQQLIAEQFPEFADLTIEPVATQGHDNRIFRLGDNMLVRLPSAHHYAVQVAKEQQWLPILQQSLSYKIPQPIACGKPTANYPWSWSIYQWIEGQSADSVQLDEVELLMLAYKVAVALSKLHDIAIDDKDETYDTIKPGYHNFYRGDYVYIYDPQLQNAVKNLQQYINVEQILDVWEQATSTQWPNKPLWVHGDLTAANIILQNKKFHAIIDFGCMTIGDPACDLTIAWTLFHGESRKMFKEMIGFMPKTWARARGWALWKALITLEKIADKKSAQAQTQLTIINDLIAEHIEEYRTEKEEISTTPNS